MNGLKTTRPFAKGVTVALALFVSGAATGNDLDDASVVGMAPPLSERLARLEPAARADATLEFEWLGETSSADRALGAGVVDDWSQGRHDAALETLRALEASGAGFGVGIAWSPPRAAGFADLDARIGTRIGARQVKLDSTGEVALAVVQWGAGGDAFWTVHRSDDGGATWVETFEWGTTHGIVDVDAVIVGDFLYVAYIAGGSSISEARLRRCVASTGVVDTGFGFEIVLDAAPDTMAIVALCGNPDDGDDLIFMFAAESSGALRYAWDASDDGKTFSEMPTGISDVAGGLAVTAGHDRTCDELHFISYRTTWQGLQIARKSGVALFELVHTANNVTGRTSISAYGDTVICGYQRLRDGMTDAMINISPDCGDDWYQGVLGLAEPGVNYYEPTVTARGGDGLVGIYYAEAGAWDPVYLRTISGHPLGVWSDRVVVNDHDVVTGTELAIQWMPPVCFGRGYGFAYISDLHDLIPYFGSAGSACAGDVNGDMTVDVADILELLASWGPAEDDRADTNCDGVVDVADILTLLSGWGPCWL